MSELDVLRPQESSGPTLPDKRTPLKTSNLLKVLFIACVVLTVVAIWSYILEIRILENVQSGLLPTEAEAEANDQRQMMVGIMQFLLFLFTWITFLVWTYRVNSSVRRLGTEGMQFTPGWSVGWYFIPLANLWKPFRAMREIWVASKYSSSDWKDKPASSLVGFWWALWLASGMLGQVSMKLSLRAEELDELITASYIGLFSDAIDIPLYLVLFALVSTIMGMQMERFGSFSEVLSESDAG
jgi:hypothetical protein